MGTNRLVRVEWSRRPIAGTSVRLVTVPIGVDRAVALTLDDPGIAGLVHVCGGARCCDGYDLRPRAYPGNVVTCHGLVSLGRSGTLESESGCRVSL